MKNVRAPFDERGDYVARKSFRFHGRTYARGAVFPWRTLSCSARKLFQLYDNGFLLLASEMGQPEAAAGDSPEAKAERRREAGRKAAASRKRNAEAKGAAEAPAPEAAGE